jgi:hypothetical protein
METQFTTLFKNSVDDLDLKNHVLLSYIPSMLTNSAKYICESINVYYEQSPYIAQCQDEIKIDSLTGVLPMGGLHILVLAAMWFVITSKMYH